MTIAICSAEPYVNQMDEDIWLRDALTNMGHAAVIVAWDSTVNWSIYDCAVLRSAWGYHRNMPAFLAWLDELDRLNVPLLNPTAMVRSNIRKNLQIEQFKKSGIPFVPSVIIPCGSETSLTGVIRSHFPAGSLFVMKPVVSASGENTQLIDISGGAMHRDVLTLGEAEASYRALTGSNDLILQPYIPEIAEGEYAVVYIGGNFSHCVLRFPAIFDGVKDARPMPNPPDAVVKLAEQVISSLSETPTYARVDIVNAASGAMLMELELAEPALLYRCTENPKEKIKIFAEAIVTRLRQ